METKKPSLKKNIVNVSVLLALIGFTFYVIFRNSDGFSLKSLGEFVSKIHWPFLAGAFLCMFLNIGCKGLSIGVLSKALGYRKGLRRNYAYASADIYFSAITPSATGGQPASAYYMVKDGIPISHTTAILSVNLLMYTASLMALSLLTFIVRPKLFITIDSWIVKVCIIVGLAVQLLFLSVYVMIMISEKVVITIATWLVKLAALVRIVKDKEEYIGRIEGSVRRFKASVMLLSHNKKALLGSFLCNFIERIVYISIGVLVFYGALYNIPELAGVKISVVDIYALEAFCWFGAYCVPLPGAVGASEAIFNNVFKMVIANVVLLDSTMVITRGINFYISFLFAGTVTLVHHIHVHFFTKSEPSGG
ncbi:MAG: flippase-like domain-containing protein [Ruminococcus sp.]|nr:flippase-like domain-containing protein [Ruminococcus sp.]